MKPLFSPDGDSALAAVMRLRPLLAFDFDGTLAPIVLRPDDAAAPPAIVDRLRRLAALAPVAIVTGRGVADVTPRLGFAPRYVIGNHGAEDPQAEAESAASGDTATAAIVPDNTEASRAALRSLRERIAQQLEALQDAGVEVEDKHHSMALHYRRAQDQALGQTLIEVLLTRLDPALKAYGGKCVVNIVAAAAPDKGDAVHSLVRRCGAQAAVFVGDDLNDEAVFARAEPHWLTVRIGHDAQSKAMFFIERHEEIETLLDRLLTLQQDASPL